MEDQEGVPVVPLKIVLYGGFRVSVAFPFWQVHIRSRLLL